MNKRLYDKLRIGFFGLALGGLFFASVLHKPSTFSEEENRFLAERPEFTVKKLLDGSFMMDYETYIVDQFPERSFFTGIKTLVERGRGRQDDNEVYFGKDGYLFGKYDRALFESEMAKRNVAALIKFSEEYKKLGKEHFQVVMVPSSSEILKGKLPNLAPVYNQRAFLEGIREKIGEEFMMDAAAVLEKNKDAYIYYHTDHHWTSLGAYYTYHKLMEQMKMAPRSLIEFEKEEVEEDFLGTYDSKVNTSISGGVMSDYITLYSSPHEATSLMILDGKEEEAKKGIYVRKHLESKDKYSVFMGGNHGTTEIRTGTENKRSILILKDSFAHSLVPFLIEDYNRIVMVDLRHFNKSLKNYIKENHFTDILVLYSAADFVADNNVLKLLR